MGREKRQGRERSLPEQSRGRNQKRVMEGSRYNCERGEGGRVAGKNVKSLRSKLMFTPDQHWLQEHQAEESLGV